MSTILHAPMLGVTERPVVQRPRVSTPVDDMLAEERRLSRLLDQVRSAISDQLYNQRVARRISEKLAASLGNVPLRIVHAVEHYSDDSKSLWKSEAADRLAQYYARVPVPASNDSSAVHYGSRGG